eukprot:8297704-Pyramimonas_sp.AAC.2
MLEGGWLHVEVATDDERAPEDLQHGGHLVQDALVRAREPLGRVQVNRDQHHAPRAEARVAHESPTPDVDDRAADALELPHAVHPRRKQEEASMPRKPRPRPFGKGCMRMPAELGQPRRHLLAALHRGVRLLDGNKVGPTNLRSVQQGLEGRVSVGVHCETDPGTPLPRAAKS